MTGPLQAQPMALREFCPVCRGRGLVRVTTTGEGSKACVSCPHCTDPGPLLNVARDLIELEVPGDQH